MRRVAWVSGVAGALLLAGAVTLIGTGYTGVRVAGSAMEPTYTGRDHLVLERTGAGEVRRGDVVLYDTGDDRYMGRPVLGRVIGVGGDRVAQGPDGPVVVNGEPLFEPYVKDGDPSGGTPGYDVRVPEGRLFVLGDSRAAARDSRSFLDDHAGTVAAAGVSARVPDGPAGLLGRGAALLLGVLLMVTALVTGVVSATRGRPAVLPPGPVPFPG
ncbi:signal peptidase I [Streptomyces nitrosporeus]|uniref:Signal peptidase I n=1 Tax=Streptomyces nitrosporeus TaxID=28894 RepID=A0A5J6FNH2_9ACTN|nr:signal peptidase I [Streptomyces nitrosporeus]